MTAEEFNALPLEARRYIENQKICVSCGRKNDLDTHYKNYLAMKNNQLFTLRAGAVPFRRESDGEAGVLYPIHPSDTDEQIKDKLKLALELNEVAPDKFSTISVREIEEILASEDEEADGAEDEDPNFGTVGITSNKTPEEADAEIKEANAKLEEKPAKQLFGAAKAAADKKAALEAKELE